jgi:hypothetical protein
MIRQQIQIRPFHVNVPEAELTELRRRINATRWPERETVTDASQGVQLETTQKLARYWATDYDWLAWPGNSLKSFQKRFVRASDHCAADHLSRFGPPFTFSVPDLFLSRPRCTLFLKRRSKSAEEDLLRIHRYEKSSFSVKQ